MLRQLVLESSPRIRRLDGTAASLVSDPTNPLSINDVTVRKMRTDAPDGSGEIINIPAVCRWSAFQNLIYILIHLQDCTGTAQAGFKWIKQLHEATGQGINYKRESEIEIEVSWDDICVSCDISSRITTFRFHIPAELRPNLSLLWSPDEMGVIFSLVPRVGIDNKYFITSRLEGNRSE